MANWWEHRGAEQTSPPVVARAVAYYRHSAQDRQENSIPIQQDQVRSWAAEHQIEIIHEFVDAGKSGLTAEGRPGFNDMMNNWVKVRNDFQFVLCLDVSRWGRFQDIDLSAQYSAECKRHGKTVIYTTIGMPRKDDPLYPVYVQFERFRAAQYSRELSDKVFRGCVRITEQGFWAGGAAPYGLGRLLLDEQRQPVQVLKPGERKSIQNQRVTLAPGERQAAATVIRIFREFTDREFPLEKIASNLNRDDILSPGGCRWDADKVRHILTNEKYVGTMVYNQTTQKLKTPTRVNPADEWVRTPEAFDGLISRPIFERARALLQATVHRYEPAAMLERLSELAKEHGIVHPSLIGKSVGTASVSTYANRFGSLNSAIQLLFAETHHAVREQVQRQIERYADVQSYDDFLVINRKFTVLVQPSVPVPYGLNQYWFFEPDRRAVVDITLGVAISAMADGQIIGYLIFPRLLTNDTRVRVFGTSESRLGLYGHYDLDLIEQLAGRTIHT